MRGGARRLCLIRPRPTLPAGGGRSLCPRPRNLRRADRHRPPLRRRAAAAARGAGRRGGRGPRGDRPRDAGDGAVRPLHPGGIWRARPHHGGGGAGRARVRADHAGLPLGVRHQCRDRQPGPGHGRHATSRRREWLPRHRQRRDRHQLRADRARAPARTAPRCRPARCATATSIASPAASASSPMPTRPSLFTVMARTGGEGARGVSAFLVPRRPARRLASASPRRRWASRAPMSATSISTTCRCRPRTGSARKARASRSRCACSTAAGCTSPRSASASAERLIADCVAYAIGAQAVRQADRRLPADPGDDRRLARPRRWRRGRWCWRRPR